MLISFFIFKYLYFYYIYFLQFSVATGKPKHSSRPPSNHKYRRNPYGRDVQGGGVIIPCQYEVTVKSVVKDTIEKFEKEFTEKNGNERIVVS